MIRVRKLIERRRLTQAAAAKWFGVTQPRVSDLVRSRIDLFSIDMLVRMLAQPGVQVRLVLKRRRQVAYTDCVSAAGDSPARERTVCASHNA